jgi:hypothetical protein
MGGILMIERADHNKKALFKVIIDLTAPLRLCVHFFSQRRGYLLMMG